MAAVEISAAGVAAGNFVVAVAQYSSAAVAVAAVDVAIAAAAVDGETFALVVEMGPVVVAVVDAWHGEPVQFA